MKKLKKYLFDYGLLLLCLVIVCLLGTEYFWNKSGLYGVGIFYTMLINTALYSYVNGWLRGRFDKTIERKETLKARNANRISRKNKQETQRW